MVTHDEQFRALKIGEGRISGYLSIASCASCSPGLLQLPDGPLTVTPGSVGCPAHDDSDTDHHVSEAGSPQARYAALSVEFERIDVELIAPAYPWESAAMRAERNGRADWAFAPRTVS